MSRQNAALIRVLLLSGVLALSALLQAGTSEKAAEKTKTASEHAPRAPARELDALFKYIDSGWRRLRRGPSEVYAAAGDPKLKEGAKRLVYVSRSENLPHVRQRLQRLLPSSEFQDLDLRTLPNPITKIKQQGLLYLPYSYVVPGGRFNEMYGWDSYFIVLGLLDSTNPELVELAKSMVENHLYQIRHYGTILNANRTYYLTRSQPPFLTQMVLEVYRRIQDKGWLESTMDSILDHHRYWSEGTHRTPTGLARYYDTGKGPAPEVLASEIDAEGKSHYERVRAYYKEHEVRDYDESLFYDAKRDRLTSLYYVADRSMRESGFDPSSRFGPFNAGIIHYNPVCLNTLLYVMERDLAEIYTLLGKKTESASWKARAEERKAKIEKLFWDEQSGLYLDYDFKREKRRVYPFATTFWPLWAGIASREHAARVVANLPYFEAPGGLRTSRCSSGNQWDAPFGWANLQLLAIQGLRNYGYRAEAERLSINFLSLVLKEFTEHRAIFEKYDVEDRESSTSKDVRFGYSSNEIGFGWTNAAFLRLYRDLPKHRKEEVLQLRGVALPKAKVASLPRCGESATSPP